MKCTALFTAVGLALTAACAHATAPVDHVMLVSDTVTVTVNADGSSTTDRTELLKALDSSGANALQTLTIPFNADRQSIKVESASVAGADETYAAVPKQAIVISPLVSTARAPEYSQAKRLQIHFPPLAAGAVISAHTIVTDRHPFLMGGNYSFFQLDPRTMPLGEISYTLIAPTFMHLNVHANALTGGMRQSAGTQTWTFTAEKLPALYNIASESERLGKSPYMVVSQSPSPDTMGRGYLARILPSEHVSLELQSLADSLGQGSVEPDNLMMRYYAWINAHLTLIDIPLGLGNAQPRKAEDIVLSGYGTAEDRVIVLQSLMRAKSIPTDLVFVPSLPITWSGTLPAVPQFYNRLLLTVHDGQQPLDIGNPVLAMGAFGPRDRGKFGIRVAPAGGIGVMQVPDHSLGDAESALSTRIDLEADGSMIGNTTIADYGDLAAAAREQVMTLDPLALRARLTRHAPRSVNITIGKIDSPYVPDNRFVVEGQFSAKASGPDAGGYMMKVPRIMNSLSAMDDFANAKGAGLCQRTYREEDTTIHSAAGHPFLAPHNVDITADGGVGQYTATYEVDNAAHTLTVKRAVTLRASDINCDHAQQTALANLAGAVRSDLSTSINVLR